METSWLIDESRILGEPEALEATQRVQGFDRASERPLNVALYDLIIQDTHKWFGGADVRVDALVVTPAPAEDRLYQANTFLFSGVKDGQRLGIDPATGLGAYTGWPQYFLDLAVLVSRGGEGQKSLGELMAESADELGDVLSGVAKATTAIPEASAIAGAASAALRLTGTVLRLLQSITGTSIGLYRATWYEYRDRFGLGIHPEAGGRFSQQDFEFRYEIFQDAAAP